MSLHSLNKSIKDDFRQILHDLIDFCYFFSVQGSHRDSNKQNKDTPTNSNLNNANTVVSNSKNIAIQSTTTTNDPESSRNGPYFDVSASKNVSMNHIVTNWFFFKFQMLTIISF